MYFRAQLQQCLVNVDSLQLQIASEGVIGIARAFLAAGSCAVLVSLWSIDDEATVSFMTTFYDFLKCGKSACEALNETMAEMRKSSRFRDPFYWAPFILIGDDVTVTFPTTSKAKEPSSGMYVYF